MVSRHSNRTVHSIFTWAKCAASLILFIYLSHFRKRTANQKLDHIFTQLSRYLYYSNTGSYSTQKKDISFICLERKVNVIWMNFCGLWFLQIELPAITWAVCVMPVWWAVVEEGINSLQYSLHTKIGLLRYDF